MVDQDTLKTEGEAPAASEHLSSLREAHLQQLASELNLGYYRLESAAGLVAALRRADLAQDVTAAVDLRGVLGLSALTALVLLFLLRPHRLGLR
jgi:mxaL protein